MDGSSSNNPNGNGYQGNSNRPINGLRNHGDEAVMDEEVLVVEDDLVEVLDLDRDSSQAPDVSDDLDMLDLEESDEHGATHSAESDDGEAMADTQPERDDAKLVFSQHQGSVFCVGCRGDLAVTGGEDDKAFVWDTNSGSVLFTCTGHKDSVTAVGFNSSSDLVATGDLSGCVQVWSLSNKTLVWSFEVADLEWLTWHPNAPILLAGTVDGEVWMWKIPGGDTKTLQSFGSACGAGLVMPDGKRAVAGYSDGAVRVWDLKSSTTTHTFTGHTGHTKAVTSVSCHSDNSLVLTGSMDVTGCLLNATTGKLIAHFDCQSPRQDSEEDSVESVAMSETLPFAALGTLSGNLSVWDIPSQKCRQVCVHSAGIVKVSWHEALPLIYTSALDGVVRLWDARSGTCERSWGGHSAPILDFCVHNSRIVSTSDDKTARVFSL